MRKDTPPNVEFLLDDAIENLKGALEDYYSRDYDCALLSLDFVLEAINVCIPELERLETAKKKDTD